MKTHELWISPARPAEVFSGSSQFKALLRWGCWVAEPKVDGWRCVIIKGDGGLSFLSRQGKPLAVPASIETGVFDSFPPDSVLDGEWVRSEGLLYLFDIPVYKGELLKNLYQERRHMLKNVMPSMGRVRVVEHLGMDAGVVKRAHDKGYEGVVFKDMNTQYPQGKTRDWLKCKT